MSSGRTKEKPIIAIVNQHTGNYHVIWKQPYFEKQASRGSPVLIPIDDEMCLVFHLTNMSQHYRTIVNSLP